MSTELNNATPSMCMHEKAGSTAKRTFPTWVIDGCAIVQIAIVDNASDIYRNNYMFCNLYVIVYLLNR